MSYSLQLPSRWVTQREGLVSPTRRRRCTHLAEVGRHKKHLYSRLTFSELHCPKAHLSVDFRSALTQSAVMSVASESTISLRATRPASCDTEKNSPDAIESQVVGIEEPYISPKGWQKFLLVTILCGAQFFDIFTGCAAITALPTVCRQIAAPRTCHTELEIFGRLPLSSTLNQASSPGCSAHTLSHSGLSKSQRGGCPTSTTPNPCSAWGSSAWGFPPSSAQ